jgi:acetyltransferase
MSTYRLDRLFQPGSVALVGASPRERSLGRKVLANLRSGGFGGPISLVNPRHRDIDGVATVPSLAALPAAPDLVVITAPAPQVPSIVHSAGQIGCAAAVIITAGLGHGPGSLADQCRSIAYEHGLRIIGPNGIGVLAPHAGLNASFAARPARAGDLALISQSGAVVAGLIEWAAAQGTGFSGIVSLGDALDVDFGDLLDHFALDRNTRVILLYVEAITEARKFMSAARAAARVKPVIVLKSGRHKRASQAAATHTGALAGVDEVYDAAFRRAGLLRVMDLGELFTAAEAMAYVRPFRGRRLGILTNGGGIGVLAVDRLLDLGGTVAELSRDTLAQLDQLLPSGWSHANPVDIIGDADGRRYAAALAALLSDGGCDAILVMNVPTALASPFDAAQAIVAACKAAEAPSGRRKPIFAAWIDTSPDMRGIFETAGIPNYPNEAEAVAGFMHHVRYREAQEQLLATPPSLPAAFKPDVAAARGAVRKAASEGRRFLDPLEVSAVLDAYRIPAIAVRSARDPDEAVAAARSLFGMSGAVVLKIRSRDITHKSDVGGVALNLQSEAAVRQAAESILASARAMRPAAQIDGLTVHPMVARPHARELVAGIADDPTFGPVVMFGSGGTAVEVINDKALALPPLDLHLARDLIERTRTARLLKAYRDVPAADQEAVALLLVKVAQLAADLPEVAELDLNPILADHDGVVVADARIALAASARQPRLAIMPYPTEWERAWPSLDGSPISVRPIRPDDEELIRRFLAKIEFQDLRLRFFVPVKEFGHVFISRLTQLDYARAIAFAALQDEEIIGIVRLHCDANHERGEFAVLVRSDLKGRGFGWRLMQLIIEYARAQGLKVVYGQVLRENATMLKMCQELGFRTVSLPDTPELVAVELAV